ncbi:hypothetical protein BKA82DRAFT_4435060 [Pisolithus tinctorius]|nr:hypothetical protein BKA82DRAFT_4435060 [Pisolithus tinctorius]
MANTWAPRTELAKRVVGDDVAICSVLQGKGGGRTADRNDKERLRNGVDMVDSPRKSDAGYGRRKRFRSANAQRTLLPPSHGIPCLPVSYGPLDERVGLHSGEQSGTNGALALRIDITGTVAQIGIKLASSVMRGPLCSRSVPVGTERVMERRCFPNILDSAYLETIAALYSIHGIEMEARDALDIQLTKAAGELSVDSFTQLLSVIGERIEDSGLPGVNEKA